jgi:membrane protein
MGERRQSASATTGRRWVNRRIRRWAALPKSTRAASPERADGATAITVVASPGDVDRTDPATAKPLTPREFVAEVWNAFFRTGVTALATQFAYSLFFAAFPLLILVMSLAALVDRLFNVPIAETLQTFVDRSAPAVLQPVLHELIDRAIAQASTGTASASAAVAVLLAVWGASGAVGTLVGASGRAYGVRAARSYPVRRLVNALLATVLVVLIVASAVLFVFGEAISRRLVDWIGGGGQIETLISLLRWALVIGTTAVALLVIYRIGPNIDLSFVWLLPGAALATVLWLLLLRGFSLLLRFTNPGDPYGAFGSLVVLLWFFYLAGVVFMTGIVLNAVLSRRYDKRRRAAMAARPQRRMFADDGREVS